MNEKIQQEILKQAKQEFNFQSGTLLDYINLTVILPKAIKSSIQSIAYYIVNNKLKPCTRCEKDGVSMGYIRRLDAGCSIHYEECPTCEGWTVVSVKGNTNELP